MYDKSLSQIIEDTENKIDAEKWRAYQDDIRLDARVRRIVKQELHNNKRKYN